MAKPIDKKARRELREKLVPCVLPHVVEMYGGIPPSNRLVVIGVTVEIADELAVAVLGYDAVLEVREREAKAVERQKKREADALAKNNRKALRGDFDPGPEGTLT